MSGIHYKFKSTLDYDKVIFDGTQLAVADLKRLIMEKNKIGSQYFDLQITNAQTGEVYKDPTAAVPRNTSVNIARIPLETPERRKTQKIWDTRNEGAVDRGKKAPNRDGVANLVSERANLSLARNSDMSEEDKLSIVMHESAADYDPVNYQKSRQMTGTPHASYICPRCNQTGHWVNQCPKGDIKRTTGIPKEDLVPTDANDPQAMVTASGLYVVPRMHRDAKLAGKTERHPFLQEDEVDVRPMAIHVEVPLELKCKICGDLMRDAVLIPCCGFSFCDDCIRSKLLESDEHECPHCSTTGQSPDSLVANSQLRLAVQNFQNETGYAHVSKKGSSEVMSTGILRPPPSVMAVLESTKGHPRKDPQEPIFRVNLAKQPPQRVQQPTLLMGLPGPPVVPEPKPTGDVKVASSQAQLPPSSSASFAVPRSVAPGVTPPPQVAVVAPILQNSISTPNLQASGYSVGQGTGSAVQPPPPGLVPPAMPIPRPLTEKEFYEKKYKLHLQDQDRLTHSELERKFEQLLERRRRDSTSSSSTDSSVDSTDSRTSSDDSPRYRSSRRRSRSHGGSGTRGSNSRPRAHRDSGRSAAPVPGDRRKRRRSDSYNGRRGESRRRRSNSSFRSRRRSRSRSDPSARLSAYAPAGYHTGAPGQGHFYSSAIPGPIIPPLRSQTTTFYGPPIVPFSSAPFGHPPTGFAFGYGMDQAHHPPPGAPRWQMPSHPLPRSSPPRSRRRSTSPRPRPRHTEHRPRDRENRSDRFPIDDKPSKTTSSSSKSRREEEKTPKKEAEVKKKSRKESKSSEKKKKEKSKKSSTKSAEKPVTLDLSSDKSPQESPPDKEPKSIPVIGSKKQSMVVVPQRRPLVEEKCDEPARTGSKPEETDGNAEISEPVIVIDEAKSTPIIEEIPTGKSEKREKTETKEPEETSDSVKRSERMRSLPAESGVLVDAAELPVVAATSKEAPAKLAQPKPQPKSEGVKAETTEVEKPEEIEKSKKRLTQDDSFDQIIIPQEHEMAEETFMLSDTEKKPVKEAKERKHKKEKKHHKETKKRKRSHRSSKTEESSTKPPRRPASSLRVKPEPRSLLSVGSGRKSGGSYESEAEEIPFEGGESRLSVAKRFRKAPSESDEEIGAKHRRHSSGGSSVFPKVQTCVASKVGYARPAPLVLGSAVPEDEDRKILENRSKIDRSLLISVTRSDSKSRGSATPTQRTVALEATGAAAKSRDSARSRDTARSKEEARTKKHKKHHKKKHHHKDKKEEKKTSSELSKPVLKEPKVDPEESKPIFEGPKLPTSPLSVDVKQPVNLRTEKVVLSANSPPLPVEKISPGGSRKFHTTQAMAEVEALSAAAGAGGRPQNLTPPPEKKKRSPIKAPTPDEMEKKAEEKTKTVRVGKKRTSPVVRGRGYQAFRSRDYSSSSEEDSPKPSSKRIRRNVSLVDSSPLNLGADKFKVTLDTSGDEVVRRKRK